MKQAESLFGSPIPHQYHQEASPPYDQDEDEQEDSNHHNIRHIERLVSDEDELDFKSGDEQFFNNTPGIQSPQLSAVGGGTTTTTSGLRVPISSFHGLPPSRQLHEHFMKKSRGSVDMQRLPIINNSQSLSSSSGGTIGFSGGAGPVALGQSNSCKNIIGGAIIEGGSSSSDENKRPSTVQEQRTEEDAEDGAVT
jgi:hypothetical protein